MRALVAERPALWRGPLGGVEQELRPRGLAGPRDRFSFRLAAKFVRVVAKGERRHPSEASVAAVREQVKPRRGRG